MGSLMTYSEHIPSELPAWLLSNKQSVTRLQAGQSSVVNMPKCFPYSEPVSDEYSGIQM